MSENFKLTVEEYEDISDNNGGYCTACGEEAYDVEPDARNYTCESCEQDSVFGLEELMMMGKVEIIEGEDEDEGD